MHNATAMSWKGSHVLCELREVPLKKKGTKKNKT